MKWLIAFVLTFIPTAEVAAQEVSAFTLDSISTVATRSGDPTTAYAPNNSR